MECNIGSSVWCPGHLLSRGMRSGGFEFTGFNNNKGSRRFALDDFMNSNLHAGSSKYKY